VDEVVTPVPGLLAKLHVTVGAKVAAGDLLFTMLVMKMEVPIVAESDGVVTALHASEGDELEAGAPVLSVNKSPT
jgi:propionyl-CoA carboxylase alpha chain